MSLLGEMLHYICGPEAPVKTTGLAEQQALKQNAVQAMLKVIFFRYLLDEKMG